MQLTSGKSKIIFTAQAGSELMNVLKDLYSKVVVLVDENTKPACLPLIEKFLPADAIIITIPAGEEHKHLRTCEYIWNAMTNAQLDRKAVMVNLGGGVIGDMGGFCASTYKRGINFIQIPTTLLSQVDASVGGKLGIDFHSFKNHIGVFCEPQAVIIDINFLKTLPPAEIRSGYAEIIKHCLIADAAKWKEISAKPLAQQDLYDLAVHSVKIKAKIAEEDPTEKGLRKILNFGHTVGHAVESYFLNIPGKRLLHGEAIAVGMIAEAYLAFKKSFISQADLDSIVKYIIEVYGRVTIFDFDIENILPLTLQDKKNENNVIQCSLLKQIGEANFNQAISLREVKESLEYYVKS